MISTVLRQQCDLGMNAETDSRDGFRLLPIHPPSHNFPHSPRRRRDDDKDLGCHSRISPSANCFAPKKQHFPFFFAFIQGERNATNSSRPCLKFVVKAVAKTRLGFFFISSLECNGLIHLSPAKRREVLSNSFRAGRRFMDDTPLLL